MSLLRSEECLVRNTTHGSGWMVQVLSTPRRSIRSGAPRMSYEELLKFVRGALGVGLTLFHRKDLNNPQTAVCGICRSNDRVLQEPFLSKRFPSLLRSEMFIDVNSARLSSLRYERNVVGSEHRTPNGVPTPQRLGGYKHVTPPE